MIHSVPNLGDVLRDMLAVNAEDGDEAHLRCVCKDCVAEFAAFLRPFYADIAEHAARLPLVEGAAPITVEAFRQALHRLHVLVSNNASTPPLDAPPRERVPEVTLDDVTWFWRDVIWLRPAREDEDEAHKRYERIKAAVEFVSALRGGRR